jgi:hypothetical protein
LAEDRSGMLINRKLEGFEVLTAEVMKSTAFWDIMSYTPLTVN